MTKPTLSTNKQISLKQRFENIRKNAKCVFKLKHGSGKVRDTVKLTDQQVWHFH